MATFQLPPSTNVFDLQGTAQDDQFLLGTLSQALDATIVGGAGRDRLEVNASRSIGPVLFTTLPANDTSIHPAYRTVLNGTWGPSGAGGRLVLDGLEAFVITTGPGNDTLAAQAGDDWFSTGAGDDLVLAIAASPTAAQDGDPAGTPGLGYSTLGGQDTFAGGPGFDTLVLDVNSSAGRPVEFILRNTLTAPMTLTDAQGRSTTFSEFENISLRTGAGADRLDLRNTALLSGVRRPDGSLAGLDAFYLTGDGDDTVLLNDDYLLPEVGAAGVLRLIGGAGQDRLVLDFSQQRAGLLMSLPSGTTAQFLTAIQYSKAGLLQLGLTLEFSEFEAIQLTGSRESDSVALGSASFTVALGDGADAALLTSMGGPVTVQGGSAFDQLELDFGGSAADVVLRYLDQATTLSAVNGGQRPVAIQGFELFDLRTGSGNDLLDLRGLPLATETPEPYARTAFAAGSGDDVFLADAAVMQTSVSVDGGPGTDQLVLDFSTSRQPIVLDRASYWTGSGSIEALTMGRIQSGPATERPLTFQFSNVEQVTIYGGLSNDVFDITHPQQSVIESSAGGVDRIRTFVSYSLPIGVEHLDLLGDNPLRGQGNEAANRLRSNLAASTLTGGDGADVFEVSGSLAAVADGSGATTPIAFTVMDFSSDDTLQIAMEPGFSLRGLVPAAGTEPSPGMVGVGVDAQGRTSLRWDSDGRDGADRSIILPVAHPVEHWTASTIIDAPTGTAYFTLQLKAGVSPLPPQSSVSTTVEGTSGNDVFTDQAGGQTYRGLAGVDTLRVGALASGFRLGYDAASSTFTLTDRGTGAVDRLEGIEQLQFTDRSLSLARASDVSYADLPASLYQFFIVAFGAAPGAVYMDIIAQSYRAGAPVRQIVDAFLRTDLFQSVYPSSLGPDAMAAQLVESVVRSSASAEAKVIASTQIASFVKAGSPLTDVVMAVFGALAAVPASGDLWSGTARQFANQIAAARYYTEVMDQSATDVSTLQSVLRAVGDVPAMTESALVELIGLGLLGGS